MIDISDGLAADLGHILKESKVGAELFAQDIPLNRGANLKDALSDGEDFELLFTLSPQKAERLIDWQAKNSRWFFYSIGKITKAKGLWLISPDGNKKNLKIKGFTHF
jgi:thiamine-monophosphate kinase